MGDLTVPGAPAIGQPGLSVPGVAAIGGLGVTSLTDAASSNSVTYEAAPLTYQTAFITYA